MRERMITRTIKVTSGVMMKVNNNTGETVNEKFELGGEFTVKECIKILRKKHETNDTSIGCVTGVEVTEKLYAMPETDFVKYARIIPARGTQG